MAGTVEGDGWTESGRRVSWTAPYPGPHPPPSRTQENACRRWREVVGASMVHGTSGGRPSCPAPSRRVGCDVARRARRPSDREAEVTPPPLREPRTATCDCQTAPCFSVPRGPRGATLTNRRRSGRDTSSLGATGSKTRQAGSDGGDPRTQHTPGVATLNDGFALVSHASAPPRAPAACARSYGLTDQRPVALAGARKPHHRRDRRLHQINGPAARTSAQAVGASGRGAQAG
jgi:hypothetical protein